MICGTPYSPAKAFIEFARDFFEYLARGEYGSALGKLDASALQRWDKVTLQRAISSATGGALITSADGLTQSAKPSVEEVSSGEYILKHRLPLEGKWGSAYAIFRFRQKPGTEYFHVELVRIDPGSPDRLLSNAKNGVTRLPASGTEC
jgi:hypothetical protein